jgi:hypothetical protein
MYGLADGAPVNAAGTITPVVVAPRPVGQIISGILFPSSGGNELAGGAMGVVSFAAWGGIALAAWLLFGRGKR